MSRLVVALVGGLLIAATVLVVAAVTGESEQERTERRVAEALCGPGSKVRVVCRDKGDDTWSCVAGTGGTVNVTVKDGTIPDDLACAL